MGNYIPVNESEKAQLLSEIGLKSVEDLFQIIPDEIKIKRLDLEPGKSEMEVSRYMNNLASKNVRFKSIFRGAGAYNHYIPSIVKRITSKEEFLTAYTPYQAEISQGILQSIFEYQTMICMLTGMDVSNASVYDGASAAAEAISMCIERKKNKLLVSDTMNPMTLRTMQTYSYGSNTEIELIPSNGGITDIEMLEKMINDNVAGIFIQNPNYYGILEDTNTIGKLAHSNGSKFVTVVNPITLGILKTPSEYEADIVVGDAQPLGMSLSFGGPYLGFMATTTALQRKLPGRIVGETKDVDGRRAYVLTLQAREQHIRREKASSNICSNQALCAMTAAVYLATMGPDGMKAVAQQCLSKAHYAAKKITEIKGFTLLYEREFFNEFLTTIPCEAEILLSSLEKEGILGGYPVEGGLLWCVTEMNTKEEIDKVVEILKNSIK